MPQWRKAILINMETKDGLFEMWEDTPLGKEYTVDITTRRMAHGTNVRLNVGWYKEVVDTTEGWMPTEILDIEE